MKKTKNLKALLVSVWHADDWFSGGNCNPVNNEFYLFGDKEDKSFVSQVDIVMTAEEVAQAGDDLQLQLYDRLHEESWRWQNVGFVETLIQLF